MKNSSKAIAFSILFAITTTNIQAQQYVQKKATDIHIMSKDYT